MQVSKTSISRTVESEEARFAALSANDIETLDPLLEEDLHYVHANGLVENKVEFLRKIRSGERRYRRFSSRSRKVLHEGGFTFVFGEAEIEVFTTRGLVQNVLVYTAIYRDTAHPKLKAWHAAKAFAA